MNTHEEFEQSFKKKIAEIGQLVLDLEEYVTDGYLTCVEQQHDAFSRLMALNHIGEVLRALEGNDSENSSEGAQEEKTADGQNHSV